MSVRDRTTQTAARRFLGRALVLAGTAAAGTSAALLLGQPAEAEPDEPAGELVEPPPLSGAPVLSEAAALTGDAADLPEAALEKVQQAGPASFPLDRLDPLELVPGEPVEHLVGGLDEEVAEPSEPSVEAGPPIAPVEPVAGPDRQAGSPPPEPVVSIPEPDQPAAHPQVTSPVRASGHPVPAVPPVPEHEYPGGNSALPASSGCAKTADGHQQGAGLPGWYPAAPRADDVRPDACADTRDEVLRGVPSPRPGATPD
ncbi:hypothetical protein [Saccharopolyspora tripterygii]